MYIKLVKRCIKFVSWMGKRYRLIFLINTHDFYVGVRLSRVTYRLRQTVVTQFLSI